ncbi:hypothetical protein [Phyllobacterium sp. SB3]|uniref:hypothetical protein n=1 Tax=Phyllobacterium sp. SB3 TaxID=3156073 RepID=UPI0032B01E71
MASSASCASPGQEICVPCGINRFGTGMAMTPAVLRDSSIKSHIVNNGAVEAMPADEEQENVNLAIHTIAHECHM